MKLINDPIILLEDKNKKPLINKFTNKPQCRVLAIFEDNKQRYGFIDNIELAKTWKAGDDLDVVLFEKESNGRIYYNFKLAGKNDKAMVEIEKIKSFIKQIIVLNKLKFPKDVITPTQQQTPLKSNPVAPSVIQDNNIDIPEFNKKVEKDEEEINYNDIPF